MENEVYELECICGTELLIEHGDKCPRCGVPAVIRGWKHLKYNELRTKYAKFDSND
jgi:hypothetical protein